MGQVLKPVNIAGALLIVQVCLLSIMFSGLILNNTRKKIFRTTNNLIYLVILAILSIILVAISYDFYDVWSPILGDISLPTLPRKHSFAVLFSIDIIIVAILISNTGGSNVSPFTSILFLIPSLAIFLREPPYMFFSYALFAFMIYMGTFRQIKHVPSYGNAAEDELSSSSHKVVNFLCLALGVITGYITRPIVV